VRLAHIDTLWTLVRRAVEGRDPLAMESVLERYSGAVYRYLLGALRDPDAADEVYQDFWLKFLGGAFRGADPQRGPFRQLLKTSRFRMVAEYYRKGRRGEVVAAQVGVDPEQFAAQPDHADDEEFAAGCREELLERAWAALQAEEGASKQPLHATLHL